MRCSGVGQKVLVRTGYNRMFSFIQGCEVEFKISLRDPPGVERFSLDLCRALKKYRKCVLEVGCMGEEVGLDRECMEFVTIGFFFFSFFMGGVVLEHPVFLNNISSYFPDVSK